jgi:hypothetical protein
MKKNLSSLFDPAITGVIGKWGLGAISSTGSPNKQGFDYTSSGSMNILREITSRQQSALQFRL